MFDNQVKTNLDQAYHMAGEVTKSVLILARTLGVKPAKMAEALIDATENANYSAEFTAEFLKAFLAKEAKVKAEAAKAK
jgi:hypothetical protein